MKNIALIADYNPKFEPHLATESAIVHAKQKLGVEIGTTWVSTEDITHRLFETYDGVWIGPGTPYKNMEKPIWAIQYARENKIPLLATCGGFQHVILEIARNILNFKDAQSAEYDPYSSKLFISELECSLAGRTMRLSLTAGSQTAELYGNLETREQYYCNFGINPEYEDLIQSSPINITGSDSEGDIRIIEMPDHPFFIATLFVPQTSSTPEQPHPLVTGFLQAAINTKS